MGRSVSVSSLYFLFFGSFPFLCYINKEKNEHKILFPSYFLVKYAKASSSRSATEVFCTSAKPPAYNVVRIKGIILHRIIRSILMMHHKCRRTLLRNDLERFTQFYPILFRLKQVKELTALFQIGTCRITE